MLGKIFCNECLIGLGAAQPCPNCGEDEWESFPDKRGMNLLQMYTLVKYGKILQCTYSCKHLRQKFLSTYIAVFPPRGGPTCVLESLQVQCIDVIAVT